MSEKMQSGNVQYERVADSYIEARQLKKSAGWKLLWAMGVGAVISGDYFGWNFGLDAGGFGGLLIAVIFIAIMYVCMVLSIAELSTAMPHAGGFYSFTRTAIGPGAAFLNSVTDMVEYVITPAVIVVGIAGYMDTVIPGVPNWVWWLVFYAAFVGINIWGTELTFRVSMVVTVLAIAVLVIFYAGAIFSGAFSWSNVMNITPDPGQSAFLPKGIYGIFAALPFAIWFYLAIEQLPLSAEESHDVVNDMPRALIYGIVTLLGLSIFTLVLNSGVGGGAAEVATSGAPLDIGFSAIFGSGATSTVLTLIGLTGLIASFHSIIYAYGRVLFAVSRAGYIPRWLSVTTKERRTPARALVVGAIIGFVIALIIDGVGGTVGAALLTMAVFGAVISYALVMISYIVLARNRPTMKRPYQSPLGVAGAWVGLIIAVVSGLSAFAIPDNRPGVWGTVIFIIIAFAYYWGYSRHHLVANAPEEEIALLLEAQAELGPAD
ncbi:MAG: ethanolamine permease [Chloroflexota bacterium]